MSNYPSIKNFDYDKPIDENITSTIRSLFIEHALNVVNNTILKQYITPEYVRENIKKNTKNIVLNPNRTTHIGDPIFRHGKLLLRPEFFTETIRLAKTQNSDLPNYPKFIKLLEIYGLTAAVANKTHYITFEMGQETVDKNTFIKSLIANYFSTEYKNKEKSTIINCEREYETYANTNTLATNMITVIAKLIGEDALALALVSDDTEQILAKKIDIATGKNDLGYYFIKNLQKLNKNIKEHDVIVTMIEKDIDFYVRIIKPLRDTLQNYDPRLQLALITFLEDNDFNEEKFNQYYSLLKEANVSFTQTDLNFIKYFAERFHEHCTPNLDFNITKCLSKDIPKINKRDDGWHEEDFTFINICMTEMNLDCILLERSQTNIDKNMNSIINLLSEEIIPRTLKNKNFDMTLEEYEDMLSLLKYQNSSVERSQKGQRQIKKVHKTITRRQKKKIH